MAYVTSVRLPEVLKDEVLAYASRGGLSFNALVLVALRDYLDRRVLRDPALPGGHEEATPPPSVARATPVLPVTAPPPSVAWATAVLPVPGGRAERRRLEKSKAKGKR